MQFSSVFKDRELLKAELLCMKQIRNEEGAEI